MEHDVRGIGTGAVEPVIGHYGPAAGCKWE